MQHALGGPAMAEEGRSCRILVIRGACYTGKIMVEASVRSGHPTFVLVGDDAAVPYRARILHDFETAGVTLVQGDLFDHGSLVKAIKRVDVVISAVPYEELPEQTRIIAAIKEAGNIKRFLPSEFGIDADHVHAVEPAKTHVFAARAEIRRAIEAEGIPHTYVASNFYARFLLPTLVRATGPSADKIVILGDGNQKSIFVSEEDVGTYTIKAVDDPRTLNKTLYLRPPGDIYTHNEIVSLWEKKTGKTGLERVYLTEEQVMERIQDAEHILAVIFSMCYSAFVMGDHTNFEIDPSFGVEASELYPDVKYTSVDEILNQLSGGGAVPASSSSSSS